MDLPRGRWLGACGSSACLEVMVAEGCVILRRTGGEHVLIVTPAEWKAFCDWVRSAT